MASMGFRHIQRFAHYHGLVSTAGFGSGTRTPSIRCSHFSRPRSTIFKHWKSHIAYRNPKFSVLTSDHIKSLQKLLEDDPIAVLDLQKIISGLRASGIGVLITDHNVRETLSVTDRAYIIDDGRIFRHGAPGQLAGDAEVRRVYLGESFSLV